MYEPNVSLSQNKIFVSLYPIFFPYIFNLPEEMAKKVHTDTLLVFMVQGEVCLVLEKRIEKNYRTWCMVIEFFFLPTSSFEKNLAELAWAVSNLSLH